MAIQPTQPQTIGGVLDTAFQLYKASITSVLPLCLLLALAGSAPSIYMLVSGVGSDPFAALAAMSDPLYWLTYVLSLVATLWLMAALYLKEHAVAVGEEMALGAALQSALRFILPMILMTICFVLAVGIGTVLLIIPGLILLVSLMLATNLIVFEHKGPIAALTGSHRLVWGNWWRTAAIVTVGFFVLFVIYMAAGLIIGILAPAIVMGADSPMLFATLSGVAVVVLINLLVTPFYIGLLIAIYWDLKLRKEGGDLASRVGALNPA